MKHITIRTPQCAGSDIELHAGDTLTMKLATDPQAWLIVRAEELDGTLQLTLERHWSKPELVTHDGAFK